MMPVAVEDSSWIAPMLTSIGSFIDKFGWPGLFTIAVFGLLYWYVIRPCGPLLPQILLAHLDFLNVTKETLKQRVETDKRLTDTVTVMQENLTELRKKNSDVFKGGAALIEAGEIVIENLESEELNPHVQRVRERLAEAANHFKK